MTHGVHWLPHVDRIVVIVHGEISEVGSYDELLSHNGVFAQFLKTYLTQQDSDDEDSDPERELFSLQVFLVFCFSSTFYTSLVPVARSITVTILQKAEKHIILTFTLQNTTFVASGLLSISNCL